MTTIIADKAVIPPILAGEITDVLTHLHTAGTHVATTGDLAYIFAGRPGLRPALRTARRTGHVVHLIDWTSGHRVEHVALTGNARHLPGGTR